MRICRFGSFERWEKLHAPGRDLEQSGGHENEIGRAQLLHEGGGDDRAGNRASRPSDGDEGEEPLRLFAAEDVAHESPEEAHDKKIEDAYPDEEGAPDPDILCRGQGPHQNVEEDEVEAEKAVGDGEKSPARHAGDDGGEEGVGEEHGDERAGVHPGQRLEPAGGADIIPDRPDDIVTPENNEVEKASEEERAHFVRADVDRPAQDAEE